MGSAAARSARRSTTLDRRRRAGRHAHGPPVPAVPGERAPRGAAADGAVDRRARPHEGAGRGRRAALPDVVAALDEAMDGDGAAVRRSPAGHRRPLRAVVEGVHAGDGRRPSSTSCADRAARRRRFTVGIVDDVTHLSLPIDDRVPSRPEHAEVAGDVLRPRHRRHRRAPTRASVKIIGEHDRPARPGLLRLRLEEVRLGDGVAPALRARADPLDLPDRRGRLRRLPPVRPARADGRARARQARRDVPAQRPVPGRRGVGPPARARCSADRRQAASTCGSIDADRGRARGRHGRPHQHGDAAVLLRTRRRAARRRGASPRIKAVGRADLRPARAARSSNATSPPSTRRWRRCTRSTSRPP